jgi:hypothetical protein
LINRNVIGDTGIHAVTTEIERLRSRLDERSNEFEHLRDTQLRDSNENNALKVQQFRGLGGVVWVNVRHLRTFFACGI